MSDGWIHLASGEEHPKPFIIRWLRSIFFLIQLLFNVDPIYRPIIEKDRDCRCYTARRVHFAKVLLLYLPNAADLTTCSKPEAESQYALGA